MNTNISGKKRIVSFMAIDLMVITLSFFGAFLLRFDFLIPTQYFSLFIIWLPVFIIIKLTSFVFFGSYRGIWRYTSLWDMLNIVKAAFTASVIILFSFGIVEGFAGFPRSVFLLDVLLTIILISSARITVRLYYSHIYLKPGTSNHVIKKKILLIGAGRTGEKIAREITNSTDSQYEILGFIDDDPTRKGAWLHGYKVLGTIKDIALLTSNYDEIVITAPSATGNQMRRIVKQCKKTGKRYKTVPSLTEMLNRDISINSIRDVSYNDLLGREEVKLDMNSIDTLLKGKRILVTGAGGSIGSELVRQCMNFNPAMLILLDNSEFNLFSIEQELRKYKSTLAMRYILGDIRDEAWIKKVFTNYQPQVVLHAAAYKHVPIQESHPREAVLTNVQGTMNMITVSNQTKVEKFVLVSTDKAVHPVNVMGATKRLAEMMVQCINNGTKTAFMAVRFGNVLGSSGSVIPIFQDQIENGGPIRITHPDMIRYFMSIPEAAQLILQAGALGSGGEIFVLDMGKPVNIKDMAYDLIRLSGLEPEDDIPVIFTGVRPGEKLYEELITSGEQIIKTNHKKIVVLKSGSIRHSWVELAMDVEKLIITSQSFDSDSIKNRLHHIIPEYEPQNMLAPDASVLQDWDIKSFEA